MSRGGGKRRYRIRRKKSRGHAVAELAGDVIDGDVVGQLGCCVVEAVASASILVGLLLVPTYLLLS